MLTWISGLRITIRHQMDLREEVEPVTALDKICIVDEDLHVSSIEIWGAVTVMSGFSKSMHDTRGVGIIRNIGARQVLFLSTR